MREDQSPGPPRPSTPGKPTESNSPATTSKSAKESAEAATPQDCQTNEPGKVVKRVCVVRAKLLVGRSKFFWDNGSGSTGFSISVFRGTDVATVRDPFSGGTQFGTLRRNSMLDSFKLVSPLHKKGYLTAFEECSLGDDTLNSVLEIISHHKILFLDISYNSINIGGIQSIGRHMKAIGLKDFSFAGNSIPLSVEMCSNIESLIIPSLESLNLSENNIDNAGLCALCQHNCSELKALHLYGNIFDSQGALCISSMLTKNKSLTKLDLGGNPLAEGITQLAKALEINNTLEILHLAGTRIEDSGADELAASLHINTSLTLASICGNKVSPGKEKTIMSLLHKNEDLKKRLQVPPQGKLVLTQMKLHVVPLLDPKTFGTLCLIDLTANCLKEVPYCLSVLHNLKQLILKENRIDTITRQILKFSALSSLDVSNNLISSICDDIGNMEKLEYLNISHNNLEDLPCSISLLLRKQKDVLIANNPLGSIPKGKLINPDQLMRYLEDTPLTRKPHLWNRFRVIILGDAAPILWHHLNPAVVAPTSELCAQSIDFEQFHFQILCFSPKAIKSGIHQALMTCQSLFVIAFDCCNYSSSQIQSLKQLVAVSTASYKSNERIVFVGFNAPQYDQAVIEIAKNVSCSGNHTFVPVVNPENVARNVLNELVSSAMLLQKPHPGSWAVLANTIHQQYSNSNQVLLLRDFKHLASEYLVEPKDFFDAVTFMHDVGVLMFFHEVKDWNCVFMNPTFLGRVLFSCVNPVNLTPGQACIGPDLLERELWRYAPDLPKLSHQQIISLLKSKSMILPITISSAVQTGLGYLIPSQLEEGQQEPIEQCAARLTSDQHSLFMRLVKFPNSSPDFLPQVEAAILQGADITHEHLWRSGAVCVRRNGQQVEVVGICGTKVGTGYSVEVRVWEPINGRPILLDRAMAALNDTISLQSSSSKFDELVLCNACIKKGITYPACGSFSSTQVATTFRERKMLACPKCNQSFSPCEMAPELCSGITQKVQITCPEIEILKILGRGGFGIVFKGKWKQWDQARQMHTEKEVAVKMLIDKSGNNTDNMKDKSSTTAEASFAEFRKEVEVMAELPPKKHLISLFGVCYTPLMMVMEFAQHGDLRTLLNDSSAQISLPLMYHIARDIAKGLHALHSNIPTPYIHRDLRSPNVFLVSHKDRLRAKIGDYGLATRIRPSQGGSGLSTWEWLAPEVLDIQQSYGTESDIYSFGMVMLELVKRPLSPFDMDPQFSKETETTVRKAGPKTYDEAEFKRCQLEVPKYTQDLQVVDNQLAQISSQLSKFASQPPNQDLLLDVKALEEKMVLIKWSQTWIEMLLQRAAKTIQEYSTAVEVRQTQCVLLENKAKTAIQKGARPTIPDTCPQAFQNLIRYCWAHDPLDMAETCSTAGTIEKHEVKLLSRYSPLSKAKSLCLVPQNNLAVSVFENGSVFYAPAFTEFTSSTEREVALVAANSRTLHGTDASESSIEVRQSCIVVVSEVLCIYQGRRPRGQATAPISHLLYLLPSLGMPTKIFSAQITTLDESPHIELGHMVVSMCHVVNEGKSELWCACDGPPVIMRINVEEKRVQGEIPLHGKAAPLCMIQFGSAIWIGIGPTIQIIELATNTFSVIKTDGRVSRMTKVESFIFALLLRSKSVQIWQPLTHTLLVRIDLENPSLSGHVDFDATSICTGMGKVWIGDNNGHVTGWDFTQVLAETSALLVEAPKPEIKEEAIFDLGQPERILASPSSGSLKLSQSSKREGVLPLLQVSSMPVEVAFVFLPLPGTSSGNLLGKSSDIPLVGEIQFLDSDIIASTTASAQSNKKGILWCITSSGPKVVCCFIVTPENQATTTTHSDSVLEYASETTPTLLVGGAIARQVEVVKSGHLMIIHKVVAGRSHLFSLTRAHFTCDSKNIRIPVSEITNVEHLEAVNLRIFYGKTKSPNTLTLKAGSEVIAVEWLRAFQKVMAPEEEV
ncbi:hypothetical protein Pelo_2232 [Pelomyxa schiedti]|nr:hypothetical protein Pelo_2232 [Pelomyxa schiedti]